MDTRTSSIEEVAIPKEKVKNLEEHLFTCFISCSLMRHPILLYPSGIYVEAKEYLKWLKKSESLACPFTRKNVTQVIPARVLEQAIDNWAKASDDRYEDYELEPILREINTDFLKIIPANPSASSLIKSMFLGSVAAFFYLVSVIAIEMSLSSTHLHYSMIIMLATSLLDISIRLLSHDQHSLLSTCFRFFKAINQRTANAIEALNEERVMLALPERGLNP